MQGRLRKETSRSAEGESYDEGKEYEYNYQQAQVYCALHKTTKQEPYVARSPGPVPHSLEIAQNKNLERIRYKN